MTTFVVYFAQDHSHCEERAGDLVPRTGEIRQNQTEKSNSSMYVRYGDHITEPFPLLRRQATGGSFQKRRRHCLLTGQETVKKCELVFLRASSRALIPSYGPKRRDENC